MKIEANQFSAIFLILSIFFMNFPLFLGKVIERGREMEKGEIYVEIPISCIGFMPMVMTEYFIKYASFADLP